MKGLEKPKLGFNSFTVVVFVIVVVLALSIAFYIYHRQQKPAQIPTRTPYVGCWKGTDGHTVCA